MAADAMDVDPPHSAPADPERKRKHKNKHKDASPSKKRKHESTDGDKKSKKAKGKSRKEASDEQTPSPTQPADDSPFTLTTATLYLPLSPISISPTHAVASLLAEHLSPLLLTYYPPLKGVVLAYSNASISETPPPSSAQNQNQNPNPNPQPLTLATSANEYGVLYVYLTATFLVFRPQRGHALDGWVNVQSEGFLGAVVLNLFSVGIEHKRLPTDWKWVPPGEEADSTATSEDESQGSPAFDPSKEHFSPVTLASDENPLADAMQDSAGDEASAAEGSFQSVSGHRVRGTVRFRVVDVDVIPGTDRDRGFLSIEGTMLSPDEEARVLQDERGGVLSTPRRGQSPSPSMSGDQPAQADVQEEESGSKKPAKEKKEKGKDGEKKSKKKKKDSHE
jgi:DNA-directed RNA polymerase I subunit RPA43